MEGLERVIEVKFDNPEWAVHYQGNDYFTKEGAQLLTDVLRRTGKGDIQKIHSAVYTEKIPMMAYFGKGKNEPFVFLSTMKKNLLWRSQNDSL